MNGLALILLAVTVPPELLRRFVLLDAGPYRLDGKGGEVNLWNIQGRRLIHRLVALSACRSRTVRMLASGSAMAVATVRKVPAIACAPILCSLFIEGIVFHPPCMYPNIGGVIHHWCYRCPKQLPCGRGRPVSSISQNISLSSQSFYHLRQRQSVPFEMTGL